MTRLLVVLALGLVALAPVPAAAQPPLSPWSVNPPVIVFPASAVNGGGVVTSPQLLCPDGTAALPSCGAFASQPGLGFYKFLTNQIAFTAGSGSANIVFGTPTAAGLAFANDAAVYRAAAGALVFSNASTIGSEIKVDALPTVASGFGGSPAVTAGSTPFAGSLNIGTGGVAVSGVVNFNGTAFPSGPFCVCGATLTNTTCRTGTTTTQLTITTNVAWSAGDVVNWICASAK